MIFVKDEETESLDAAKEGGMIPNCECVFDEVTE